MGALVGPVHLIDQNDRPETQLEHLAEHELCLRHGPFGGIDQQHDAVDHAEDALDLAAEIGVARRVDDVDAHAPPNDRGAFGQDGNAPLALQLVRIESPLRDLLVVAESAALPQQAIDQRRLAMIDMGDDRDVAQLHGANQAFAIRNARPDRSGRTRQAYGNDPKRCPLSPRNRTSESILLMSDVGYDRTQSPHRNDDCFDRQADIRVRFSFSSRIKIQTETRPAGEVGGEAAGDAHSR